MFIRRVFYAYNDTHFFSTYSPNVVHKPLAKRNRHVRFRNPRLTPQPPESPESGWPVRRGSPPKRGGRDAVADPDLPLTAHQCVMQPCCTMQGKGLWFFDCKQVAGCPSQQRIAIFIKIITIFVCLALLASIQKIHEQQICSLFLCIILHYTAPYCVCINTGT